MKSGKYVWLLIIAAAILTFGTVLAGCAPAGEEPIKIGLPFGKTGAHAVQGISEDNAARLFYEQKGLQVAGRPIKLIGGDTATNPAVALATTKRMVDFDQVHLIQGYISSAVGYGVSSYADESKTPMIGLFAGAGTYSAPTFSGWPLQPSNRRLVRLQRCLRQASRRHPGSGLTMQRRVKSTKLSRDTLRRGEAKLFRISGRP